MSAYERQCRWLVAAFPPDFRAGSGEDLVATLLDDAPGGTRVVSPRTAFDLIIAGCRMRALHAGAGRGIRRGAAEGLALAAIMALAVQAALAVASAVYQAEHGIVFYLPTDYFVEQHHNALGAGSLATWVVLAAVSSAAFVAAVRGAWRIAGVLGAAASAYTISVAVDAAILASKVTFVGSTGGGDRYDELTATPGILAIGAVAAVLTLVVAVRRRQLRSAGPRSAGWFVATATLAVVCSAVGDGSGAEGSLAKDLRTAYPPQGGVITVFQCLVAGAVIIGLAWSFLDPRVGWAVATLTVPFMAYQISDLTIGDFYYGHLYQPGWKTALPLIGAAAGMVALSTTAIHTAVRLQRR